MTKRNDNPTVITNATECEALQVANSRKARTRVETVATQPKEFVPLDKGLMINRNRLANHCHTETAVSEDTH